MRKGARGLADDRCGRLGRVADALRADPDLVELLVARLVAERLRALREPVPRAPNELRDDLGGRLACGGDGSAGALAASTRRSRSAT